MKVTFETENRAEINQLAKAEDMANFIWDLVHNRWRQFKHTDYDYEPAWKAIRDSLEEYNIIPDDLVQ